MTETNTTPSALDTLLVALAPRSFGKPARDAMASKGTAMPDGSFPIPDKDALRRAVQAFGRAPAEKKAAVKAHIIRRAKALGATDVLPDDWGTAAASPPTPHLDTLLAAMARR
jgi:hypothetical protein